MNDIIHLRRTLHRYPELSNEETETAKRISAFFEDLRPDAVLNTGRTGKIFVFDSGKPGPCILFRCELDALPIQERAEIAHKSMHDGVAHLCGHDGHMAIMARLGQLISQNRPSKGKSAILFQPAEENQLGAKDVVESKAFHELSPDEIYALHNIPGQKKNTVLVKTGSFSAASCGITIRLQGRTSHAAEPEKGLNPWFAAQKITEEIQRLPESKGAFHDRIITTLIYMRLGEIAFGISPSDLEMGITLRAFENEDLILLRNKAEQIVSNHSEAEGIASEISYSEYYPATENDEACIQSIKKAAERNGHALIEMTEPNRWSEDFAYFTATNRGAQFGYGSGSEQPNLHDPEYDFPDDIIQPAAELFFEIYRERLKIKNREF
ncbi:amidohydrolase [Balneola sp. MJW-20]|uniref:amidohydrolase n=1 Tax=Gracilimonas aurantiaca TaxID=3234185 RepID=UPI0034678A00